MHRSTWGKRAGDFTKKIRLRSFLSLLLQRIHYCEGGGLKMKMIALFKSLFFANLWTKCVMRGQGAGWGRLMGADNMGCRDYWSTQGSVQFEQGMTQQRAKHKFEQRAKHKFERTIPNYPRAMVVFRQPQMTSQRPMRAQGFLLSRNTFSCISLKAPLLPITRSKRLLSRQ